MSTKQSHIISLVVLVAILIVVGLLVGTKARPLQAPQDPNMAQEADTSGTALSPQTDSASIEQDFENTDWTSLDADMDAQVSGQ